MKIYELYLSFDPYTFYESDDIHFVIFVDVTLRFTI